MGKDSFVFYTDWLNHLSLLGPDEAMAVLVAIKEYIQAGSAPALNGGAAIAFSFIRSQIDRDAEKWEEAKSKRAEAGRAGGIAKAENQRLASASNAITCQAKLANLAVTVPVPVNGTVPGITKESTAPASPSPTRSDKPIQKKYGSYGWVKLTDEQHIRLLNDLGEPEFKRCVDYIDESAQANGNKNKWRDWNLVIRKCSRDGWGGSTQAAPPPKQTGHLETIDGEEVFVLDG